MKHTTLPRVSVTNVKLPSPAHVFGLLRSPLHAPTVQDIHTWNAAMAAVLIWRDLNLVGLIGSTLIAMAACAFPSIVIAAATSNAIWLLIGLIAFFLHERDFLVWYWGDLKEQRGIELTIIFGGRVYEMPPQELGLYDRGASTQSFDFPGARSPLTRPQRSPM